MTDTPLEREVEGPWIKLRRRKVVQWGVAYAAGAWGLLQGLEYVSNTFDWSKQIQQVSALALLIGLPIVLVLAWYHGDRGEQRVTGMELAILTLLFLLGGGFFWRYEHASEPTPVAAATPGAAPTPATTDELRSIAVLPFVNMSGDPENEYFADGLTEEVLNSLSQVSDLKVTGRTSSFAFKGKNEDLRVIGETLGVTTVLEGSVRRAGDRARITAQLVRVADGFHLWSEAYDRTLNDAFAVQLDIAQQVVRVLEVVLDEAQRERMRSVGVRNVEAFIAFQKGQAIFMEAHSSVATRPMLDLLAEANLEFARATALEKDLAKAYMLSADIYGHQLQSLDASDADRMQAIANAQRELELASRSARDPRLRAMIDIDRQLYSEDWRGLAARVLAAAELPGCEGGNWAGLVTVYGMLATFDRIEADLRKCDPLNDIGWSRGMVVAGARGAPGDVLELAERVPAQLGPSRNRYLERIRALATLGRLDEARAVLALMPGGTHTHAEATLLISQAAGADPIAMRAELAALLAAMPRSARHGTGEVDLTMTVNNYAGDREANNRLAAAIDARPGGAMLLTVIGENCACGAAWDLDRTPNFKRRLEEAGLTWPPKDIRPPVVGVDANGSS